MTQSTQELRLKDNIAPAYQIPFPRKTKGRRRVSIWPRSSMTHKEGLTILRCSVYGKGVRPCSNKDIQWTIRQFHYAHPDVEIGEKTLMVLYLYNFKPFHTGYLYHIFEHIFCFLGLPNRIGSDFFGTRDCLERTGKKITKELENLYSIYIILTLSEIIQ